MTSLPCRNAQVPARNTRFVMEAMIFSCSDSVHLVKNGCVRTNVLFPSSSLDWKPLSKVRQKLSERCVIVKCTCTRLFCVQCKKVSPLPTKGCKTICWPKVFFTTLVNRPGSTVTRDLGFCCLVPRTAPLSDKQSELETYSNQNFPSQD